MSSTRVTSSMITVSLVAAAVLIAANAIVLATAANALGHRSGVIASETDTVTQTKPGHIKVVESADENKKKKKKKRRGSYYGG